MNFSDLVLEKGKPDNRYEQAIKNISGSLEYSFMRDLVKPGDVCVDAGAYCGFTAYIMLELGASKVYAFEADPRNFARLSKLASDKLLVFNLALSDRDGEAELFYSDSRFQSSTLEQYIVEKYPGIGLGPKVTVKTARLDSIVKEYDFMKVDVEGHEEALFRGTDLSHRPRLLVEDVNNNIESLLPGYDCKPLDQINYACLPKS